MEQNFNFNEFLIEKEKEIQEKVSFAKEHALSLEEYKNVSVEEAKMWSIKKEREFTNEEIGYFVTFLKRVKDATVFVKTIPESRRVMELLNTKPDHITHLLAHENAHANKAEELGAEHVGYDFLLHKESDGGLIVGPRARTNIPRGLSEEEERLLKIKILSAPDEYGNKTSEHDKMEIQKLLRVDE